jgi:Tfp pilus assembly protein PilX
MRTEHDERIMAIYDCRPRVRQRYIAAPAAGRGPALRNGRGVALILVMLSMLILTMLAATIVFTARAETFASSNYKLDTQADYLAKAGIQRAVNWFRSTHYQPVTQDLLAASATRVYQVTDTGSPYYLYLANGSGVQCRVTTSYACSDTSSSNRVQLIGYGSGSSNYPDIYDTESTPRKVMAAFASDLNDPANTRITADTADSGYFNINAKLLYYETINLSPPIPSPLPSNCRLIPPNQYVCAVETWKITSKGTWTGVPGSTTPMASAEEEAIVQPIYWPTWGNALYGYCSVNMFGSTGVCTDGFNSNLGAYAGGNVSVAAGACDQTTSNNVIASGAGIGANGWVDLSSNVTVGGNVSMGNSPAGGNACCTANSGGGGCAFSGSASQVAGEVINGPNIPQPTMPSFPSALASAPCVGTSSGGCTNLSPTTVPGEDDVIWAGLNKASWPYTAAGGVAPAVPPSLTNCAGGVTCNGTAPSASTSWTGPYLIKNIVLSGSQNLNLIGGLTPQTPVYYDIGCLSMAGSSTLTISGYVVLNIAGSSTYCSGSSGLSLNGNGIANAISSPGAPPIAMTINYAGTKGVAIGGNGAASMVLQAPYADVSVGGCGSSGYVAGSIEGLNVSLSGGCPMHYDVSLSRTGGTMGQMISTAYGRKKM